ncbi:MAG: thermonuclease family protein [Deltaproteobacteria bacterium]|nr:thermonuclease family protein [Deltaproteobacteria bacterium]
MTFQAGNPANPDAACSSGGAAAVSAAVFAAALILLSVPASAENELYRGQVVSVQDGDTITVTTTDYEQLRVRFYGIDCPEKNQNHGPEAKEYLTGLVFGKTVDIEVLDIDRYSRQVGLVRLDGTLINQRMIEAGYAWTYEQYCKVKDLCADFRNAESSARGRRAGLWADSDPVAPWDHRRSRRKR